MQSEKVLKSALNKAFRELRKEGFIAKQGFMFTLSAMWHEANELSKKMTQENKKVEGFVGYHKQDLDSFEKTGKCYIAFSCLDLTEKTSLSDRDVAQIATNIFKKNKIKAVWNGDEDTRILLDGMES